MIFPHAVFWTTGYIIDARRVDVSVAEFCPDHAVTFALL
jgi:hypothetical protein